MVRSIPTGTRRFHAVQFYADNRSLASIVVPYLAEGFQNNEPGVVVTTPEHCAAIEEGLTARGFDVKRMKQVGDLTVLDARETLETFMVDGLPHPALFKHIVGRMLDELARMHPDRSIRGYGEMVDVLWHDGLTAAAIALERLWNDIARNYDLKLLCAYASSSVYRHTAVGEIVRHHTHLMSDSGEAATIN